MRKSIESGTTPWPRPRVAVLVCALAAVLVFALPFALPVSMVHTVSASYVAGFNNRAAILAAAGLSALVLIWSWWRGKETAPWVNEAGLSARVVSMTILLTCLFTACAGWIVARSHLRYLADAGYIIEQLSAHSEYGRALYTRLEFAYGPLLFYPAVAVHAVLHTGWMPAYFTTLALNQLAGLLLLAYIMNVLPIPARERKIAFVLLAIGAINPLLGLNYTFLRFLTPIATFLFATRTPSLPRTALLLALGQVLQMGISPEMGLTFLFATLVFAGLAAWKRGAVWLVVAAAPPVGVGLFLLLFGPSYLQMLQSFAAGALSLPVAPYPHLLIFLFALVWLVPMALGPELQGDRPNGIRLIGCYVLAVSLLPAAFGRCDPLHVFFNGAGVLVLSLVAIGRASARMRSAWLGALLVLVLWTHYVNDTLYWDRTADTLRLALTHKVSPDDDNYVLDVVALTHEVGTAQVATPIEVSPRVEQALKETGHYRSDYFAFWVDMVDPAAEARKIAALNTADYALMPTDFDGAFLETPRNIDGVQGFAFPYPLRNPIPFALGAAFERNVENEWTPVRTFGPYTLFRRTR